MTKSERHRRMRGRNYALVAVLFSLVILFFVVTLVKLGSN
jgi:hypothetical protein